MLGKENKLVNKRAVYVWVKYSFSLSSLLIYTAHKLRPLRAMQK